jgi:hypothetical protein
MGVGIKQGDEFISSHEKADNGYGQNGYVGSSSTPLGKPVSSNFLPELRAKTPVNSQLNPDRANGSPIAAHPFQKGAAKGPQVPPNNRPVWK